MKKREIIKKNSEFSQIINNGINVNNSFYSIYFVDNLENKTIFGITISKKNANAVYRNKAKRQLKEIINKNKFLFQIPKKYIIIIKKKFFSLSFLEKEQEFLNLLEKVNK